MNSEKIDRLQALLFDFGGTIEYPGLHLNERLELYMEPFVEKVSIEDIDRVALETVRYLYSIPESKTMPYQTVVDYFVRSCLTKLGYGNSPWVEEIVQRFHDDSNQEVQRNRPVLEKIREKYRIAVLSNNYGNTEGILSDFGILDLFEKVYDSTVVGLRKPYKEFFQHALEDLGWDAETTAYVGDRYDRDIEAPKELGMVTIWVMGNGEIKPCPNPGLVNLKIRNLSDLLDVLPKFRQ